MKIANLKRQFSECSDLLLTKSLFRVDHFARYFLFKEQWCENILQCFVVVICCFDNKMLYWLFSDAML